MAVFARNRRTGALRQLFGGSGCASRVRGNGCRTGRALPRPRDVLVSADGANVYVAGIGGVAVLSRDRTRGGALTQLEGAAGCLAERRDECTIAPGIGGAIDMVEAPNRRQLYVAAADGDRLAVLERMKDGSLTELEGGRGLPGTGAGRTALHRGSRATRPARSRSARKGLRRLPGSLGCFIRGGVLGCSEGRALTRADEITVSADGRNADVASEHLKLGGIGVFRRIAG